MEKTSKKRAPSRCREWERNRRNKFNDALSKLGEMVKSILQSNNPGQENGDAQYPKIEIVQKAIVCLETCNKEKTQLKAEILALQVTVDDLKNTKNNKKDASTQAHMILRKKKQCNNMIKVILPKNKRKVLKEKVVNNANTKALPPMKPILPKCNLTSNKGPENALVLLPASPYIFPQRPVLYPTVPPTFFLVNPNQLNKSNDNILNRNTNDITKTTMVNILPISAYSRPLSATKTKKGNSKSKIDKKTNKPKKKATEKTDLAVVTESKEIQNPISPNENKEKESVSNAQVPTLKKSSASDPNSNIINAKPTIEPILPVKENVTETKLITNSVTNKEIEDTANKLTNDNNENNLKNCPITKPVKECKDNNTFEEKCHSQIEKDRNKENKLPNILDTTLCENVVDTGNSRLELAEELLAASPTAAFLMSFPLVSGNRADSPTEESQSIQVPTKDTTPRRNNIIPTQTIQYSDKTVNNEVKKPNCNNKIRVSTSSTIKSSDSQKYIDPSANIITKQQLDKPVSTTNENPFLPMPSIITTSCSTLDSSFGLDFDCNITKPYSSQSSNYTSTNNIFYKSDPFNTVKNAIYSTSSITSSHDFNNLSLYPCAMEKYNSKSTNNIDDNMLKIGSSRLTYDIDLGWSHKSLDFVNCATTTNSLTKDNILATVPMSATYSSSYNPFNPEFHVPLVTNSNKKENTPTKSFPDLTNYYSQASNMWSEEVPFYTSNNVGKSLTKQPNYLPSETMQLPNNTKQSHPKQFESKQLTGNNLKPPNVQVLDTDKFTKKSPSKMHINWMTSEVRSMHREQNYQQSHLEIKDNQKPSFVNIDNTVKKPDSNETNYFPITMHSFPTHNQSTQEEFQVWPAARGVGTAEITIEPPPINLPTLVGDLALGPHDKKKNMESNKAILQPDAQNCGNFLSVTQLMNRSSDNMTRYQGLNMELSKNSTLKQHSIHNLNDNNRKVPNTRETHQTQTCYNYNENKAVFDNSIQFNQQKPKHTKTEKNSKIQKNNYSAEALIRGGPQKLQDHNENNKFLIPTQKYNDYNTNDSSVAQVSHFPSVLDYSDNNYAGQQFSGTPLYNSTTNTLSNSFYSNFMPSNSNIMTGNFTGGPFPTDFIDYNQTTDCNFTNHKYDELKMKNNPNIFNTQEKPTNYKNTRRESTAKHKLDCSKKESNKKYQSKRPKIGIETEEWNDSSALLWQNKGNRRHGNFVGDELPFPNYNQIPSQYQSEFFNSHLMASNMQSVGPNVDRSLASFPITSRANFNLSTIFPEITMKVQS